MTLIAHSNALGTQTKTQTFRNERWSSGVGSVPRPARKLESTASHTVPVARHNKPWFTQSDRVKATTYARNIWRVLANEPFRREEFRCQRNSGGAITYVELDIETRDYLSGTLTPFATDPRTPGLLSQVKDQAATAARNKFADGDNIEVAVSLMESRKTVEMFSGNAERFARAIRAFQRKDYNSVLRHLRMTKGQMVSGKSAADRWLEYQYGWRPLIRDIHNGVKAVLDPAIVPRKTIVKGKGTGKYKREWLNTPSGYNDSWKVELSAHCVLLGRLDRPALNRLNNFGLLNPLSVAWEVVPFSFVLDWFIPVGDVLSALSATAGFTPLGGYTSAHNQYWLTRKRSNSDDVNNRNSWKRVISSGNYVESGFGFRRDAHTNWPFPGFHVNVTPFKSATRLASAAALVRNLR